MEDLYRFSLPTGLDEWPVLRDFWASFRASRWAHRIPVTKERLQALYIASLQQPQALGVLMGWQGSALRGVIVAEGRMYEKAVGEDGLEVVPACYISGVYVDPRAGRSFSASFMAYLESWARDRGMRMMFGNGRAPRFGENNYKLEAVFERYGFSAAHIVVTKDLEVK